MCTLFKLQSDAAVATGCTKPVGDLCPRECEVWTVHADFIPNPIRPLRIAPLLPICSTVQATPALKESAQLCPRQGSFPSHSCIVDDRYTEINLLIRAKLVSCFVFDRQFDAEFPPMNETRFTDAYDIVSLMAWCALLNSAFVTDLVQEIARFSRS